MQQVRAKKSLGQHFLIDLDVAQRIAATIDGYKHLPVLEVGPGMGVLTQFLLQNGHDLKVVELDGESVDYLKVNFPALDGRIIERDFLKLDLQEACGTGEMVVIGNYPYNISSQILFHVLDYKDQVTCCSGMFQREVAQRIAAGPGSIDKDGNRIAMEVKAGDSVLYSKYAGTEVKIDGKDYLIMRQSDILGVIE